MRVAALSLESGEVHTLIEPGAHAQYSPTGHLIYAWAGDLRAVQFDPDTLEVTGPHVPVVQGVWMSPWGEGSASYSVSKNAPST